MNKNQSRLFLQENLNDYLIELNGPLNETFIVILSNNKIYKTSTNNIWINKQDVKSILFIDGNIKAFEYNKVIICFKHSNKVVIGTIIPTIRYAALS